MRFLIGQFETFYYAGTNSLKDFFIKSVSCRNSYRYFKCRLSHLRLMMSSEERLLLEIAGVNSLSKIKILRLSNRNLDSLNADLFNQLSGLEDLDLSGNQLNHIPDSVVLPKLRKINISDNMFSELYFLERFPKVEELNVAGNPLGFADRYIAACLLPNLKKIDNKDVNLNEIVENHEERLKSQVHSIWEKEFLPKRKRDLTSEEWLQMENNFISKVRQSNLYGPNLLKKFKLMKAEKLAKELLDSVQDHGTRYKNENKKMIKAENIQAETSGSNNSRKRKLKSSKPLPEVGMYELEHLLRCHSAQCDPDDNKTQVWKCSFEPDCLQEGKPSSIVATCGGCIVSLIDCSTGKLMKRYKHSQVNEEFYCLAWTTITMESSSGSFKSNILAVSGKLKSILLIHPSQLTCYKDFAAHSHPVNTLVFHPEHPTWLFSGSSDRYVHLWDIGIPHLPDYKVSPNKLMSVKADFGFLHLGFVKKNEYLLTTTEKKCLCWQLDKKKITKKMTLTCIEFILPDTSPNYVMDGMTVLSDDLIASRCSGQNHIYVWSFSQTMKLKGLKKEMQCLAKLEWKDTDAVYIGLNSHRSGLVLSGDDAGGIWVYNLVHLLKDKRAYDGADQLTSSAVLKAYCAEENSVNNSIINALCASSSLQYIVGVTDNNLIHIWTKVS